MRLSTAVLLCFLAVLLPHLSQTLAGDDGWHLDFTYTLVTEELDPVVSPNAEGSHMHKVIGGSRFGASYNYAEYSAAKCSSLRLQADKSNYWMPALYVRNKAGKFVGAPANIRFYYFNARSSPLEPVSPFPKGLRMIAGNPNNKVAAKTPAAFTCQVQFNLQNTLQLDSFNFQRDCPYGMKTELYFPNCWDGVNLYISDGSHMAYVIGDMRDGSCPISHPVRIPTIQLEYTWATSAAFGDNTSLAGNVFWANGDSTGYGIHGDFVNGWDYEVLSTALNNPNCGFGLGQAIPMQDCPYLYSFFDDAAASACRPEKGVLAEPGNIDLTPLDRLPGCNSPWGNGTKPACTPNPLDVTALKGVDGAYVADPADRMNFVLPTTPGWQQILCVKEMSTITGGSSFTEGKMTQERCQDSCMNSGFNYAATGLVGSTWNCVCGSGLDMGGALYPLMCTKPCPGNSSQACGGDSYIFNVYYAPPGTVAREGPTVDGTIPLGCYKSPGWSSGLLAALTYTLNSQTLTTESCIATCRGGNSSWALTYSGTYCGCGNQWNVLPGIMVPADQCTEACRGNASEVCGNYYMASVYDISMTSLPGTSAAPSANASNPQPTGSVSNSTDLIATNSTTNVTTPIYTNVPTPVATNVTSPAANTTANMTATTTPNTTAKTITSSSTPVATNGTANSTMHVPTNATTGSVTIEGIKGCFSSGKFVSSPGFTYLGTWMTTGLCRRTCRVMGYSLAGLTKGNTCSCGNSATYGAAQASTKCGSLCQNDSSQPCGSSTTVSIYDTVGAGALPPSGSGYPADYVACWTDQLTRVLGSFTYSENVMTTERCAATCKAHGYSWYGTEAGNECFCGSKVTTGGAVPDGSCSTKCKGNSTETCGGSWKLSLYNTTSTVTSTSTGSVSSSSSSASAPSGSSSGSLNPVIGSVSNALNPSANSTSPGYVGCYTGPTTSYFANAKMTSSSMTPLACRTWCNSKSYTYSALSTGTTCTCANSISAAQSVSSSSCNASCAGDTSVKCGSTNAFNAFSVYKTNLSARRSRTGREIDGTRQ